METKTEWRCSWWYVSGGSQGHGEETSQDGQTARSPSANTRGHVFNKKCGRSPRGAHESCSLHRWTRSFNRFSPHGADTVTMKQTAKHDAHRYCFMADETPAGDTLSIRRMRTLGVNILPQRTSINSPLPPHPEGHRECYCTFQAQVLLSEGQAKVSSWHESIVQ